LPPLKTQPVELGIERRGGPVPKYHSSAQQGAGTCCRRDQVRHKPTLGKQPHGTTLQTAFPGAPKKALSSKNRSAFRQSVRPWLIGFTVPGPPRRGFKTAVFVNYNCPVLPGPRWDLLTSTGLRNRLLLRVLQSKTGVPTTTRAGRGGDPRKGRAFFGAPPGIKSNTPPHKNAPGNQLIYKGTAKPKRVRRVHPRCASASPK